MEKMLKQIPLIRKKLKGNRRTFWLENKKNFEKNVKSLVDESEIPKKWKVYIVAGTFVSNKKIMPFDWDSWSSTDLIAASKRQGHEIMMFFNRARSEFLSVPALIPLVKHELYHVVQISRNPKEFVLSVFDDELSKKLETEADKKSNVDDEFRKQWVLESILYCYDLGSWTLAKKMAYFLNKEMENMYGGGYEKGITDKEYKIFNEAMKKGNINLFIEYFD